MPLTQTDKIWMDGKLVSWDEAVIHILTPTLHYGWGVFEGIRAYATKKGPAVFRLTDHMRRLHRSSKIYMLDVPYSVEQLVDATKETIRVNKVDSCYIRPLVYLGLEEMGLNPLPNPTRVAIAVWPWGTYLGDEGVEHGVRAKVSSYRRNDWNSIPPAGKATGQYINSSLAKVEAIKSGYDEAILLNTQGHVADGSGENVFIVRDETLITPPLASGPLAGITRDSVMKIAADLGWQTVEADLNRTDLYLADEAFFTGTAAEVVPIRSVDDREIGEPGPVTKKIQEVFFAVAKGEVEKYADWLEYVN
ncbi:MAG: branched-chain amino acid transaminase [Actinomycetota bacterium]